MPGIPTITNDILKKFHPASFNDNIQIPSIPVLRASHKIRDPVLLQDFASAEQNSYSGADIICTIYIPRPSEQAVLDQGTQSGVIGSGYIKVQGELQTLTVSSARSVHPVRRLGEIPPNAYTRGARTIAGTMIFTTIFRDAFADAYQKSVEDGETDLEEFFVDQIPRFHMMIQAANEYGIAANSVLLDIHLTNFGTTFSIDDMYHESTFTYVARQWYPFVEDPYVLHRLLSTIKSDKTVAQIVIDKIMRRSAIGLGRIFKSIPFKAIAESTSDYIEGIIDQAIDERYRVNDANDRFRDRIAQDTINQESFEHRRDYNRDLNSARYRGQ